MKQYPADFRERLLRAIDAGLGRAKAARLFGVSERTIQRWQRRRRQTGICAPQPRRGRPRRIGPAAEAALRAQVAATPDATVAQHCAAWAATQGTAISPATMSRALARLGLTVKKNLDRRGPGSGGAGGLAAGGGGARSGRVRLPR